MKSKLFELWFIVFNENELKNFEIIFYLTKNISRLIGCLSLLILNARKLNIVIKLYIVCIAGMSCLP